MLLAKEKEEAIKMIEEAKLKAEIVEETSKTIAVDHVISQETEPDAEVSAGDTVKLHVSIGTGIKEITMTNVVGKAENAAKSELEGLGFKVTVNYEENSSKENGVVLKQSLDSGKKVDEGTTVTLTVNKIQEDKSATIIINVKSMTGGYTSSSSSGSSDSSEEGGATEEHVQSDKTADVELLVDGKSVYSSTGVDKNKTDVSTTITGKGSVSVQVIITDRSGGNWTRTQTINLNNTNKFTFQ